VSGSTGGYYQGGSAGSAGYSTSGAGGYYGQDAWLSTSDPEAFGEYYYEDQGYGPTSGP
jgi:hypothetical protein